MVKRIKWGQRGGGYFAGVGVSSIHPLPQNRRLRFRFARIASFRRLSFGRIDELDFQIAAHHKSI